MAHRKLLLPSLVVLLSTALSYFVLELGLYLFLCFGFPLPVHPYYEYAAWSSSRILRADLNAGVRLQQGEPTTGIRIVHGDVQFFYENIEGNAAGFHSKLQYHHKKQGFRIIVYGDSFTAMLYQRQPWPDYVDDLYAGTGAQVYNFAVDGAGLANWRQHYFTELNPNYEFDMVVFAICCDNLYRGFTVSETRDEGYFFNRFNEPPRDKLDLDTNYRPKLRKIIGRDEADFIKALNNHFRTHAFLRLPFDLYALRSARLLYHGPTSQLQQSAALPPVKIEKARANEMLLEVLRDLHRHQKVAVLLVLPWQKDGAGSNPQLQEIASLAEQGCAIFMNGYQYLEPNTAEIAGHWPSFDGHWLSGAANSFASKIGPELLKMRDQFDKKSCPEPEAVK